MFVIYAVGFTIPPWVCPKRASRLEPRGRKSPPILNARCAASARTSSRKSKRCPFFYVRKGYFSTLFKRYEQGEFYSKKVVFLPPVCSREKEYRKSLLQQSAARSSVFFNCLSDLFLSHFFFVRKDDRTKLGG